MNMYRALSAGEARLMQKYPLIVRGALARGLRIYGGPHSGYTILARTGSEVRYIGNEAEAVRELAAL